MNNTELKVALVRANMDIKEFAQKSGIPYQKALELTTRTKDPRVSDALKAKEALGMTWDEFNAIFLPTT